MSTRKPSKERTGALHALAATSAAFAFATATLAFPTEAAAGSRDECIDAHSHGQDLRQEGLLTRARETFTSCAQSSCPALIQGDCARFVDELDKLVPSVSFGARNNKSDDLPNTTVYVDDALVATRLDDGKSYEFDPGKHTIRFKHEERETTLTVVLNQGEKGRVIVATFADPNASPATKPDPVPAAPPEPHKSLLPLVVAGIGGAALATGGVLFGMGLSKVPSNCAISTRDCAAPPGDSSFNDARSAIALANLGAAVGIGGAAMLLGGLVWYALSPATAPKTETGVARVLQPWLGQGSGGVALSGGF